MKISALAVFAGLILAQSVYADPAPIPPVPMMPVPPVPTPKRPPMTVRNSSFECRWGGTTNPSGNFRRITNGPSLAGLPSSTASFAPGGSDAGPGPQLTMSAGTAV